ncbi:DUF2628 domain-containing protein [Halomonas saccharevitans]|uniref:DUF2628 domain-containing protein n=1 Tax=Halomonas saccharevitans TaxID=416872 RepID=A0A1I7BWV8_9GAMM|nr:DUF2628 domain-containing protein [Halomonas saccharevitans]SFT91678.1 Protein of unknown function [Halomonas saccharevitans]
MEDTMNSEKDTPQEHLSQAWKTKFDLLEKVGADHRSIYKAMGTPEYKALGFRDKQRITFNLWAFVFGPLYYFVKKMWGKGLLIIALTWLLATALTLFEVAVGFSLPGVVYWIPSAVICAQFANHDYYRKVTKHETAWPATPDFFTKPWGLAIAPIGALILLFGASLFTPEFGKEMENYQLEDVSGVWVSELDSTMVRVDFLDRKRSHLTINGERVPVTITEVDLDNSIVSFRLMLNGQSYIWSLRQVFYENNEFTLEMTLHDGTREPFDFVRNL